MLNFNLVSIIYKSIFVHMTSSDLSKLYCIGFILSLFFLIQILSGILLSFIYNNNISISFYSIISISDFEFGFYIRSIHITGTSMIFLLLYIHILKVLIQIIIYNTSIIVYVIGFIIYFVVIIIAFLGYVLPLTQMSYWGLTVFSNILTTIPLIGNLICYWIWGAEFINDFSIIKVHSLHILLPIVMIFFIITHLFFLHTFVSSDGFFDRGIFKVEKLIFTNYFLIRDLNIALLFFLLFNYVLFLKWFFVFHEEAYEIFNSLKTSSKVIPEWYFLYIFSFIKSISSKLGGFLLFFLFLIVFFNIIFFINFYQTYIIFHNYINYNNFLLLIILFICSILSVNVSLLYPLILEIQVLVLFIILYIAFKII